ncbi:MAG: DciA family protein [Bacillota bacterium]
MFEPENVNSVLEKVMADMDLLTKARRIQVFYIWPKIMGDISVNAKPRRLDGDVLHVSVSSSTWAHELTMMKKDIIEKINTALEGPYIKDIHFSEHLWDVSAAQGADKTCHEHQIDPEEYREFIGKNRGIEEKELAAQGAFIPLQEDPDLSLTFQKFTVTMIKRQKYLLEKGYKQCPVCGYIYEPEKVCPHCRTAKEYRDHQRIIATLETHPEMSDTSLSLATGVRDRSELARARQELDSRWHDAALNGIFKAISGNLPKDERKALEDCIANLLALRTNKHVAKLTEKDIENALGKRFLSLMNKAKLKVK